MARAHRSPIICCQLSCLFASSRLPCDAVADALVLLSRNGLRAVFSRSLKIPSGSLVNV